MNSAICFLTLVALLSLLPCARTLATTVTFHAEPGQQLVGARIEENVGSIGSGDLVGFVGDSVELSDGQHKLAIVLQDGYQLAFTLGVTQSIAAISEVKTRPRNCGKKKKVTWTPPRVEVSRGKVHVLIDDPQFGQELGKGSCLLPMMGGCTQQKIILSVSSMPSGAQIWIDGEPQSTKTDAILSVPYCESEDSKTILIRYPNFTNCKQVVQNLAPDKEIQIQCHLESSPPSTSVPATQEDCSVAERFFCEITDFCECKKP